MFLSWKKCINHRKDSGDNIQACLRFPADSEWMNERVNICQEETCAICSDFVTDAKWKKSKSRRTWVQSICWLFTEADFTAGGNMNSVWHSVEMRHMLEASVAAGPTVGAKNLFGILIFFFLFSIMVQPQNCVWRLMLSQHEGLFYHVVIYSYILVVVLLSHCNHSVQLLG